MLYVVRELHFCSNFLFNAGVCFTTRGGGNPSVSRAGEGYGLTVITVHEDANPYDGSVARYTDIVSQ